MEKKHVISNAFAIPMLPVKKDGTPYEFSLVRFKPIAAEDVPRDVYSVVGHADTAAVLSGILGFQVNFNRETIRLDPCDVLYVAQYSGPRLPEGATELPDGAKILFYEVSLKPEGCAGCSGGGNSCEFCTMLDWTHGG